MKNTKTFLVSLKALIAAFVIATAFVVPTQRAAAALPDIRVTATDVVFYFQGYLDGLDDVHHISSNSHVPLSRWDWLAMAHASANIATFFSHMTPARLYFLGRAEAFHRMANSVGEAR